MRHLAFRVLRDWDGGQGYAERLLEVQLGKQSDLAPRDRALAKELVFGVLRHGKGLDFCLRRLRQGKIDPDCRRALHLGLYQLFYTRISAHAAVDESVSVLPKRRQRDLVNAILRRASKEKKELLEQLSKAPIWTRYSLPKFLAQRWEKRWGNEKAEKLGAWMQRPSVPYFRLNRLHPCIPPDPSQIEGLHSIEGIPSFYKCSQFPAEALAKGWGYLQDPATRLACQLLAPKRNEVVLDAFASPGGKASMLAELMENQGSLIACDRAERLGLLQANLTRLGLDQVEVKQVDWEAKPLQTTAEFDKILLDVPCSNTGVMGRRVDLRWRLREDFLKGMQERQLAFLTQIAKLAKKQTGQLVYSTCSLEEEENENVVRTFVQTNPNWQIDEEVSSIPWRDNHDGAYAARLVQN